MSAGYVIAQLRVTNPENYKDSFNIYYKGRYYDPDTDTYKFNFKQNFSSYMHGCVLLFFCPSAADFGV